MAVLDNIRLIFDSIVGLWSVEKVQNLECGISLIHNDQLHTFDVTVFVGIRNTPVVR